MLASCKLEQSSEVLLIPCVPLRHVFYLVPQLPSSAMLLVS